MQGGESQFQRDPTNIQTQPWKQLSTSPQKTLLQTVISILLFVFLGKPEKLKWFDLSTSRNLRHSFSTSFPPRVASHSAGQFEGYRTFNSFTKSSLLSPLRLFLTAESLDLRLFSKLWKN
jgi:hypothetical protein